MFTDIIKDKRVITKEIKLDHDIGAVLSEYNFQGALDFFYLPNDKGIRIEVLVFRDKQNHINTVNLKLIGEVKEFAFFELKNQIWTLRDQHGEVIVDSDSKVIYLIMEKIREFWDWYV
jgi:hypothetical protein